MSKYKDEAERNIDALHDWQSMEGTTDATLITVAIEAQASATLYLAEQQRIANLIALANRDQGAIGKDLDDLRMGTAGEVWEALGLA